MYAEGPTVVLWGGRFLMREVPLYTARLPTYQHGYPFTGGGYRGTSLIRKRTPLGPYRRPVPRVLGVSHGGGRFLMGEVPLYFP